MGKKKKKEKKKKVEDNTQDLDTTPAYSLNAALHAAKKTETTLQSLMREVSEEKGFVKKEEEEKIRPHLSHEHQNKIAEDYALEDVPIAQRKQTKKSQRTLLTPESKKKATPSESSEKKPKTTVPPKIEVEVSTVPTPVKEKTEKPSDDLTPTPPAEKTPVVKKDNIYLKLTEFFGGFLRGYNERYERWENTISNILAIMRKMRKITKKNTEDLVSSINNLFKKIQAELELFKVKRTEVEKVAEVDVESMSGELKRVLGLHRMELT